MDNVRFVIGLFFVCFTASPLAAMETIIARNVSGTLQAEADGPEVRLYKVNTGKKEKFFAKNFAQNGSLKPSIKGLMFLRGDSSTINKT
jgi:hypothetical protein